MHAHTHTHTHMCARPQSTVFCLLSELYRGPSHTPTHTHLHVQSTAMLPCCHCAQHWLCGDLSPYPCTRLYGMVICGVSAVCMLHAALCRRRGFPMLLRIIWTMLTTTIKCKLRGWYRYTAHNQSSMPNSGLVQVRGGAHTHTHTHTHVGLSGVMGLRGAHVVSALCDCHVLSCVVMCCHVLS